MKKLISSILTAALIVAFMPLLPQANVWAEDTATVTTTYIDAYGKEKTVEATPLTGSETADLPAGWYVVNSNINYTSTLSFIPGDVHIILGDGCTMNIGTEENPIDGAGIYNWSDSWAGSTTIYGQSGGTGFLNIFTTGQGYESNHSGIYTKAGYTQNGGNVMIQSPTVCVASNGTINTNGGELNVNSSGDYALYGPVVSLCGGRVDVIGDYNKPNGVYAGSGTIYLGYSARDDYIRASQYTADSVVVPQGMVLKEDGSSTNYYSGSLNDDQKREIWSKKLVPSVQNTPVAEFIATGADSGTLSNVDATMSYSTDLGETWTDITETTADIPSGISVENGILVKKRGEGNLGDSIPQTISVTQAEKPAGLKVSNCTTPSANDGKIIGTTSAMEYKMGDGEWQDASAGETTGLAPGTYNVRVKATGTTLASENSDDLIITAKNDPPPKPEPEPEPEPEPAVSKMMPKAMKAKGKTALTIAWRKVDGAQGYDIFFAKCGKTTCKKIKTIKGNKTFSWTKKGLKTKTHYKAYVRAWAKKNGKKKYIGTGPTCHAYTANESKHYTNAKSVTVKKKTVTLKVGKTSKIKAKVIKYNKKKKLMPKWHTKKLRYLSTNTKIATVSKSGTIKAKSSGTCSIYVYAHNGVYKKIKVTVSD